MAIGAQCVPILFGDLNGLVTLDDVPGRAQSDFTRTFFHRC